MYPVLFSIGPVTVYTFGIFAFLGFFLASFVFWKRGREANYSEEELFDAILVVTLSGLAGARLVYILSDFDRFGFSILTWLSIIRVPGLMISGGLLGGSLALWLVSRRKRWSFFSIADIGVTALALAQAIGWIGALFSGFGAGRVVGRFGIVVPGSLEPRFPAQLLWSAGFLVLFYALWRVESRYRTFEWYRGRKAVAQTGFLTFFYFTYLGLLTLVVSAAHEPRVYLFWLPREVIGGIVASAGGLIGLYSRSGRELPADIRRIRERVSARVRGAKVALFQRVRRSRAVRVAEGGKSE